jgi:hypothetical protein
MMQMSFAPSDRLRASRVRAALACALELHNADPAASACASSAASLDHMDWEIGSLPINALAIAIALTGNDLWTGTFLAITGHQADRGRFNSSSCVPVSR